MVTKPEMLNSDPKNPELLDIQNDLDLLQNWVIENFEPYITQAPHEKDWAIKFKFEKDWRTLQVVTRKEWSTYTMRVNEYLFIEKLWRKDWKRLWQTSFTADNTYSFNLWFWSVMNNLFGVDREENFPTTIMFVYNMLNHKNEQDQHQSQGDSWERQENWNNSEKENWNKESTETTEMPKWLRIENGVYIYRVQSWDARSLLISKLSQYEPLSYLKSWYGWQWDGANSFNVGTYLPDHKFDVWVDIIVPNKEYTKNVRDFKKSQLTAIENMKKDKKYWDKIKKLFLSKKKWWYWYSEEQVANALTAYARSESSRLTRNENVWECALFRYEPSQVFSYWYHHVALSYKNWKPNSRHLLAGDKALNSLNFKIWDTCDPIKSGMLCLAYCIEKNPNEYYKFFDIENNLIWCCDRYNWGNREKDNPNYDDKLKNNYAKIKDLK